MNTLNNNNQKGEAMTKKIKKRLKRQLKFKARKKALRRAIQQWYVYNPSPYSWREDVPIGRYMKTLRAEYKRTMPLMDRQDIEKYFN